jgi:hypothetical protein
MASTRCANALCSALFKLAHYRLQANTFRAAILGDVVSPAICIEPHCQYTCEMEPDQRGRKRLPLASDGFATALW